MLTSLRHLSLVSLLLDLETQWKLQTSEPMPGSNMFSQPIASYTTQHFVLQRLKTNGKVSLNSFVTWIHRPGLNLEKDKVHVEELNQSQGFNPR
ncbi:hypothetical protein DFH29DRAFT_965627 [Suillus ampliporus]|nr:hypothetical protein DFH29DRAFT_965627 [Suillus ampliporus]